MRHTTRCPECGTEALVEWRAVLESTDGPIEHVKVRCGRAHAFLLTVAALALGYRGFDAAGAQHLDLPILAICLLIATIGCLVGGQGRIFYAADDWIIRDAVLADLVSNSWPPSYNLDNQSVILEFHIARGQAIQDH